MIFARLALLADLYISTRLEMKCLSHLLSRPFFLRLMLDNTIIRYGFCEIQNNQGLGKGNQPQPSAHLDLDYSGYHKNPIQQLLCLTSNVLKKVSYFYSCQGEHCTKLLSVADVTLLKYFLKMVKMWTRWMRLLARFCV